MLRRDITPEEFDAAITKMVKAEVMYGMFVARGDIAPWDEYRVASHQANVAVRALFETEEEHPEERCQRCGGLNMVWHAPSPLWNAVMRQPDEAEAYGIVCPRCFAQLAEAKGVAGGSWCVSSHYVTATLNETDGSGRRWDKDSCRWVNVPEEPPTPPAGSEGEGLRDPDYCGPRASDGVMPTKRGATELYEVQALGQDYRVTHRATDSRIATCYDAANAHGIVRALNENAALRAEVERLTRCVKLDGALIDAAGRELNKAYVVRDRLRLDWLSKQLQGRLDDDPEGEATIGDVDLRGSWNSVGLTVPNRVNVHGSDLRDAIDAARTAGEGRDG